MADLRAQASPRVTSAIVVDAAAIGIAIAIATVAARIVDVVAVAIATAAVGSVTSPVSGPSFRDFLARVALGGA